MCGTLKRHHRRGTCCWRDLIRALEGRDFAFVRNNASHAVYMHRPSSRTVAVLRGGRDISNGTLAKLLRDVRHITGSPLTLRGEGR